MYLVNQFGRVREISDGDFAQKMIDQGRMRLARQEEIDQHLQGRKRQIADKAKAKGTGIYYSTVKRSPEAYGMSRDLL